MTTQNKTSFRLSVQKLMYNISILYQNGEITTEEKDQLCRLIKHVLLTGDCDDLLNRLKPLRYGTMFPDVVDECIQLVTIQN